MSADVDDILAEIEAFADEPTVLAGGTMVRELAGKEWSPYPPGMFPFTLKSPCKLFLLAVVLPVTFVMGLMLTAMVLVEYGIYLEFLRPLWSPFPDDSVKWIGGAFLPLGLFLAYRRCRMKNKR